ncbi:MAG: cysteine dioxygenase [Gammaproteobacteria bacterium]
MQVKTASPRPTDPRRLRDFIREVSLLVESRPAEPELLGGVSALLAGLVKTDDWLVDECACSDPGTYQQYLLHADAQDRFSVVSFVWGPGQMTPVHNHTVWGVIGVLRGAERAQRYCRQATGRWLPEGPEVLMQPGDVDAVSPAIGDVHSVRNAFDDRVSISIHVYGANIGTVRRAAFTPDGQAKPFVSGYSNRFLPNLWAGS